MRIRVLCLPLLAGLLLLSVVGMAQGDGMELYYDDDEPDGLAVGRVGTQIAVKFFLPTGWTSAKILTARYHIYGNPDQFTVHLYDSDGITELITPFSVTPTTTGWFDVPIFPPVEVSDDFYIALEFEFDAPYPQIGWDNDDPDLRSYSRTPTYPPGEWTLYEDRDWMIRAVVELEQIPELRR